MKTLDPATRVVEQEDVSEAGRLSIWERIPRWISLLGFSAVIVGLWQAVVSLEFVPALILPPPADVGREIARMVQDMAKGGFVLDNLSVTAQEVFIGFLAAAAAGFALGTAVAESAFGRRVVLPFAVAINAAPKVAFAPLFVAWLGFGIWAKVAMAAFIAFFPLMIDTAAGLASVDADQAKLFRSIRASKWQTFYKLKLPNALPFIFAGLKTAAVLAVVGAIVGEFLGGGNGFGQLIRIAGSQLNIARVFAFVTILSVGGYLFYGIVAWVERRVVFWRAPELIPGPTPT